MNLNGMSRSMSILCHGRWVCPAREPAYPPLATAEPMDMSLSNLLKPYTLDISMVQPKLKQIMIIALRSLFCLASLLTTSLR